jgi:hypothetical protein
MTTLQQITFAAKVQIGSKIKGYGGQTLIVTSIEKDRFEGVSEYAQKKGYTSKLSLSFETLANPHYNKTLEII